MKQHEWTTALGGKMKEFLEFKRLSGFKYEREGRLLERFDDYCAAKQFSKAALTREIAECFVYGAYYEKPDTRYAKERLLRYFGKYLYERDGESYVCPQKSEPKKRGFTPYIFTESELYRFFQAVDQYPPHPLSNRHKIDPLLFRMLYGCGLRISEALHLRIDDVDATNGTLLILQAKNNKDRLVPMAEGLRRRCEAFLQQALVPSSNEEFLFPSPLRGTFDKSTVYRRFREYLWEAGISHSGHGPRIHDLRHTFCVHCLKRWVLSGKDILNLMPYLSAYLGHADFRGTQYYLRLTADLYPDILSKEEAALGCVFPERSAANEDE
jgi:integrase/recombinase XerD